MTEREKFAKGIVVICDTREQKNKHIIDYLDKHDISHIERKLDYGDYSFTYEDKVHKWDFSMACVAERKANVDELYNNIMADRSRLEKELDAASKLAKQMTIFIENVGSSDELKKYALTDYEMLMNGRKFQKIGEPVYDTLESWRQGNRYNFDIVYCGSPRYTARKMLDYFYRYWHNYKELIKARK